MSPASFTGRGGALVIFYRRYLRRFAPYFERPLVALLDARGVEGAAHDVVADTGQVLDATTADEHDRVLLERVTHARDVALTSPVRESDTRDLAQRGVRLLRRLRVHAQADAALAAARLVEVGHLGRPSFSACDPCGPAAESSAWFDLLPFLLLLLRLLAFSTHRSSEDRSDTPRRPVAPNPPSGAVQRRRRPPPANCASFSVETRRYPCASGTLSDGMGGPVHRCEERSLDPKTAVS